VSYPFWRFAAQTCACLLTSMAAAPETTSILPLTRAIALPEGASGAAPGRGFTCTGLARDPTDGAWWIGNDGRAIEGGGPRRAASILRISADFSTILAEYTTLELGLEAASIQGVAYDADRDSIWFALRASNGELVNIGKDGVFRARLRVGAVNGLAYDAKRRLLITLDDKTGLVQWRDPATGAARASPLLRITARAPDQLSYDAQRDAIVVAGGPNRQAGWVETWSLAAPSPRLIRRDRLQGADAIEGIALDNGRIYLTNDAFFHRGAPPLNRVLVFTAPDQLES